jgi:hypothetical protein
MEPKYTAIDTVNEVDLVDFTPTKFTLDDGTHIYCLSIVLVRDKPREINDILTGTVTDSLEEMAVIINTILSTGMFDGKQIAMKTVMMISDRDEPEPIDWETYGVEV